MVRVAFVCEDDRGIDSEVSSRFARAKYFIIVDANEDVDHVNTVVAENPATEAKSGAGIKAVQRLVEEGVDVVVAGGFGPNAMAALDELGIRHVEMAEVKVSDALKKVLEMAG